MMQKSPFKSSMSVSLGLFITKNINYANQLAFQLGPLEYAQ